MDVGPFSLDSLKELSKNFKKNLEITSSDIDENDMLKDYPFNIDVLMDSNAAMNRIFKSEYITLTLKDDVLNWFANNKVKCKYSVYFGIIYFKCAEDKVKFILRWL